MKFNPAEILAKIKSFFIECKRVLSLTKKPSKEEEKTIVRASLVLKEEPTQDKALNSADKEPLIQIHKISNSKRFIFPIQFNFCLAFSL